MKLKVLAAGAIAALTLVGAAGTAFAAPPSSGYDDKPDRAEGAGSDTTYAHMQLTERLFNQAQGCDTDNTAGSATLGNCKAVGSGQSIDPNGTTGKFGNWDHDYAVSRYPTGSGAGIGQVIAGTADYGRSSRGPNATGETALNFWGYGKDGIAIVSMNGRAGSNITKAQLQGIYNCSITTWDQITGNVADVGKTIQPVGMNPASGTKSTFQTYLGFDPNAGACVKKLALTAAYPFENDLKPVLDPANGIDTANAIWWMSYAEFKAYSYKRQSAALWQVDGKSLSNATVSANTWPITRFIYHVALKTTVDAAAGTETWSGTTGGAQGAVRELTRFICSSQANAIPNDFTGVSNYDELSNIYSQTGFIRIPSTERTNGVCRKVAG
jgi:ABC-type phosphate transport system substrate-binding protein